MAVQAADGFSLAEEPLAALGVVPDVLGQHLDRHVAVQTRVMGASLSRLRRHGSGVLFNYDVL